MPRLVCPEEASIQCSARAFLPEVGWPAATHCGQARAKVSSQASARQRPSRRLAAIAKSHCDAPHGSTAPAAGSSFGVTIGS
mmetsp:Transcript_66706/g.124621  ORF Transcript_66706/g.124621 Transcript_66706/m.124621 type:complete len:82 (+) Transcript_66706:748-993(+)